MVKAGLIDEMQLQSALARQRQWGGKLGDILVNNGFLDEMMLWRGLSKQLGVQLVSLPELKLPAGIEKQVPLELCEKHSIFPLQRDDKALTVATSDPGNVGGIDEVAFRLGVRLKIVLAPDREVQWAIRHHLQGDPSPCPPPRERRVLGEAPSSPSSPSSPPSPTPSLPPQGAATPIAELARLAAAQAQAVANTTAPTPETEAMIRETAHLLRFLVEACAQRGIFTREEYLQKLKSI